MIKINRPAGTRRDHDVLNHVVSVSGPDSNSSCKLRSSIGTAYDDDPGSLIQTRQEREIRMKHSLAAIAASFLLAGAAVAQGGHDMQHSGMPMGEQSPGVSKAIAVLLAAANNPVHGTVTFERTDKGIKIVVDVDGLTPGKHGFHIHEYGDCSAPDFSSAGSHFMTSGQTHGTPADPTAHMGDMGNLEADSSGHAHMEWVDPHISFSGPNSILGRSVVVHEKEDDLKSQPSGNSGARIACGVIGIAKP
jgi:Cu-Zn family superoxide dismutase